MFNTIIFSISNFLLVILLLIAYIFKIKDRNINNILYNSILICLLITLLSEIVSVYTIFNNQTMPIINEIVCRIRGLGIIIWNMLICLYLISLDVAHDFTKFKNKLVKQMKKNYILPTFLLIIVCFFFFKFDYVLLDNTAYLSGFGNIYIFFSIILILLLFITSVSSKSFSEYNKKILCLLALCEIIIVLLLSYLFPYVYFITTVLTLNSFLLYFITENPDLYAIKKLEKTSLVIQNLNTSKTDFYNNITNEMKSPIEAIVNISDILLKNPNVLRDDVLCDMKNILYTGNKLNSIITNVLDMSKIESDSHYLLENEYDLNSLLWDIKISFSIKNNKNIKFDIIYDENIPKIYIGNRSIIYKILINLLDKSIEYTDTGKITLKVDYLKNDKDNILKFTISDTGIGLKKEEFNKVSNILSGLDNDEKGLELGFALTKRMLDIIDAKLTFNSEYGVGTSFSIELKQEIVGDSKIGSIEISNEINYIDYSNFNIIIVDENDLNSKVIEELLIPYKFNINISSNIKDFIYKIKNGNNYDLIFIDQMILKSSDMDLMKVLKSLSFDFKIPPIIILVSDDLAMISNEINLIYDSLQKPINNINLDRIINKYINK